MIHVYVICEGQTEVQFVEKILAPHFGLSNIFLYGRLLGRPGHKGGNVRFDRLSRDVRDVMRSHTGAFCTTFFDFYGLAEDFPGKSEARKKATVADKASQIRSTLTSELEEKLGSETIRYFIPYVQMYEFEALLFSDPKKFAQGINQSDRESAFVAVRDEFNNPEEINDSPDTAPSKRVSKIVPRYQKPLDGRRAAESIGLAKMRSECSLFDSWLNQIEQLKS